MNPQFLKIYFLALTSPSWLRQGHFNGQHLMNVDVTGVDGDQKDLKLITNGKNSVLLADSSHSPFCCVLVNG